MVLTCFVVPLCIVRTYIMLGLHLPFHLLFFVRRSFSFSSTNCFFWGGMTIINQTIQINTTLPGRKQPDFARDDDSNGDGEHDGSDNNGYGDEMNFGAQHVIALIDCHPDMFVQCATIDKNNDDNNNDDNHHHHTTTTPFDMSLQLILTLMQQTIEQTVIRKTGKRNGVGLFLYNTRLDRRTRNNERNQVNEDDVVDDDDKMDDEDDDHGVDDNGSDDDSYGHDQASPVHELLDLVPPGIQHVLTLRHLVENKRDRDLRDEFCPDNIDREIPRIAPLQTAIEDATRKFITAKCVRDPNKATKDKEFDHRSIWIFTNQVDPYPHDSVRQLVYNVANEAKEQKISIVVWPLCSAGPFGADSDAEDHDSFESPFFDMLASQRTFESRMHNMSALADGLEDIMAGMRKNRRSYFGPMHILGPNSAGDNDDDCAIMIDWYPVVQLAKRPGYAHIDDETKR